MSGFCLTRRLGLSVCAPMIRNGRAGCRSGAGVSALSVLSALSALSLSALSAREHHAMSEPPRTRKYRPGSVGHTSASATSWKSASRRRSATEAQAWNGDGDASMKRHSPSAVAEVPGAGRPPPRCDSGLPAEPGPPADSGVTEGMAPS